MLDINTIVQQPVRQVFGKVEFTSTSPYQAGETSTIVRVLPEGLTAPKQNPLTDFTVERTGENKFFGFGIVTKATVHFSVPPELVEWHEQNDKYLRVMITAEDTYNKAESQPQPQFIPWLHVTDRRQDEKTRIYSYTAYDNLEYANGKDLQTITLPEKFTAPRLAGLLLPSLDIKHVKFLNIPQADLAIEFNNNYDGKETIRQVLNEIAEVTQSIYYIDIDNDLVFKRLDRQEEPYYISRANYTAMESHDNRRLQTIAKVTELGDNVSASTKLVGSTQNIRNNSLLELRTDIDAFLEHALAVVGDMTIADCVINWRGNPTLELGRRLQINFKGKDCYTYLLNDTITFDGTLSQKSQWKFEEVEGTFANPSNIGDLLNDTFAKVDKVNKKIDIVVQDNKAQSEELAAIRLNQNSISATVSKIEKNTQEGFEGVNQDLVDIKKVVDTKLDAEQVSIQIQKELSNGVDKITTKTGFTFDENGLTIDKSDSTMSTTISEDGMKITKNGENVLIANNTGVDAYNLWAKTYLIIGNTSRFEDYQSASGELRTGCFWIGGE